MALHKRLSTIFFGLVLVFSGFLIHGCAQKMAPNPALEEARSAIQNAQTDPVVVNNAPLELQKAEQALNRGEELFEKGADQTQIEQQAYLARQHVAIAWQIGERKVAEESIRQASAERNRILLEARGAEAEYARQQAERQKERAAGLEAELAELEAVKAERGMVITLGDVVFDVGKAELKPGGLRAVDNLAEFMKKYPSRNVMIEGFTDSTGSAEYNQVLSERRAKSVRDALVARGVDPSQIETRGYGQNFPIASNDNAAGRQLNRRVEIVISNGDGDRIPERTG